jgi:hypothetical protein
MTFAFHEEYTRPNQQACKYRGESDQEKKKKANVGIAPTSALSSTCKVSEILHSVQEKTHFY